MIYLPFEGRHYSAQVLGTKQIEKYLEDRARGLLPYKWRYWSVPCGGEKINFFSTFFESQND